jgi:hypothetical protein
VVVFPASIWAIIPIFRILLNMMTINIKL